MIFDFDHIRPLLIEVPYVGTFKPPCRDVKWPWTCTRPEGHTGRHAADVGLPAPSNGHHGLAAGGERGVSIDRAEDRKPAVDTGDDTWLRAERGRRY